MGKVAQQDGRIVIEKLIAALERDLYPARLLIFR
jgi:hypothetical protein